jgi:hypothetical protein
MINNIKPYELKTVPTKDDILGMLSQVRMDGMDFWRRIDPDRFWSRENVAWSPADNVRHLILSTTPVARALRIPRLVLHGLFGVSPTPSRTWNSLCSTYLGSLSSGATAGRYAPTQTEPSIHPTEDQQQLVEQFASTVSSLEKNVMSWRSEDLDRYRLPHPILGRLTLREMLMFTLFHIDHHRDHVARRYRGTTLRVVE